MAKAKSKAKAKRKAMGAAKTKSTSKSSTGLRKTADNRKAAARGVASPRPSPRKAKAQLPGEKAVRDTRRAFRVEPERVPPGEREPMPDAALDRRRQIVGTDDRGNVNAP